MIAQRVYRVALRLLPAELHRKHGDAMQAMFARDVAQARAHGPLPVLVESVRGVWDVVRRATYEQLRPNQMSSSQTPMPTTRQLLRGHARSFAIALVLLTVAMLSLNARGSVPRLQGLGASTGTIVEALLLSIPFVAALTIPMAVLLAVLCEFSQLGVNGTLATARQTRDGVRRLVLPVLAAAMGVTVLSFVVTAEVVPRTNQQLTATYAEAAFVGSERSVRGEREMTISELRTAARDAQANNADVARVSMLEVEVHKKLALPAACLVFAVAGMALAFRIPRGGWALVVVSSIVMIAGYYTLLMAGEKLADQQRVSPTVAMWGANAVLTLIALTLASRRVSRSTPSLPVQ